MTQPTPSYSARRLAGHLMWGVLGLGVLASCSKQSEATETAKVYSVDRPQRSNVQVEREHVGEVQALRRVELHARVKGWVEAVLVDEGQRVEAGQVLFKISTQDLQQELRRQRAGVASAAAELKSVEIERTSTRMLRDKGVVSNTELALLDARVLALRAKLDEAKAGQGQTEINLSYAEVRAPFGGVVNRVPLKVGSMVDEGALLTTLTDTSEVLVYFRVSEREFLDEMGNLQLQSVGFTLANGARLASKGRTDAVAGEFEQGTGTIALRARFANAGGILKHGSTGKVVIESEMKDALTVPLQATFEVQDQIYVFVVDAKSHARARRIVPKLRVQDRYVLESGLDAHEQFVAEGLQRLKDGDLILTRLQPPVVAARP